MKAILSITVCLVILGGPLVAQVAPGQNIPVGQPTAGPVLHPEDLPQLADLPQGLPKNFIRTFQPQQAITDASQVSFLTYGVNNRMIVGTQYFDGIGRPLQEVQRSTNNSLGSDLVVPHVYDGLGREALRYLPYQRPDNTPGWGRFDASPSTNLLYFYNNNFQGQSPYSRTRYDGSPLSRVTATVAPGYTVGFSETQALTILRSNELSENVQLWRIGAGANDVPLPYGAYPAGELEVKKVMNEDNQFSLTYTNKLGQVVLVKRKLHNSGNDDHADYACTYNVYNEMGQLRYVITPEAVNAIDGNWNLNGQEELCYRYCYDERGHMIEKKVPGKAVEYMVYDYRDRMVLSQDGNLRAGGKWAYTVYDGLDRPMFTGVLIDYYAPQALTNKVQTPTTIYQSGFEQSIFYGLTVPNLFDWHPVALNDAELMVHYFYDDYSHAPYNMNAFDNSLNGDLPNVPNAASLQASAQTAGLLTGMKVRSMDGSVHQPPLQSINWLSTVNFYDEKGQLLEVQSQNYNGGVDITLNGYDRQGTIVGKVQKHSNPLLLNTPQAQYATTKIVRRYTKNYFTGAVTKLEQKINAGIWRIIYANSYDPSDRVSNKLLGGAADNQYTYNVRGWLTGINRNSLDVLNTPSMFFKERISYETGFVNHYWSGNIAGIEWRGAGYNVPKRFYGYHYDRLSRLDHAEFGEETVAGSASPVWSKTVTDYTASGVDYDRNGNLRHMKQMGPGLLPQSSPIQMDNLAYSYAPASNQLLSVSDGPVSASSQNPPSNPDFRDGNTSGNDYVYDANGNLIIDKNKGITTAITYNLQNKPEVIVIDGKGTITYMYDALGNRLRKTVTGPNSTQTVTDYIGAFVYEDNALKYISHEEGRCRPTPGAAAPIFMYDYFIRDHLGNVRSTIRTDAYSIGEWLSEAPQHYHTGLEVASASLEALTWSHIGNHLRVAKPGSNSSVDTRAADLDGDDPDRRVATALMIRVMPGDRFSLNAETYRPQELGAGNQSTDASGIMEALLGGLLGGVAGGETGGGGDGGQSNTELLNNAFSGDIASQWDALSNNSSQNNLAPQSHLNYLVLDENMQVVGSQSGAMQAGAPGQWQSVGMSTPLEIGQAGYLLIFTSNKSSGSVYWDNVDLTFYRGQLMEEDHYYPFGLTLNTLAANGREKNDLKLTTKELQGTELGLNWYDFGARIMDEQIGRWTGIDPKVEKYSDQSGYNYVSNNPVKLIDPDGAENVIYLVVLPSSTLGIMQTDMMIRTTNQAYEHLGLPQRVVWSSVPYNEFNIRYLDPHDQVAVMGSTSGIISFIGNFSQQNAIDTRNDFDQGGIESAQGIFIGLAPQTWTKGIRANLANASLYTIGTWGIMHGMGHHIQKTSRQHYNLPGHALQWSGSRVMGQISGGMFFDDDGRYAQLEARFQSLPEIFTNEILDGEPRNGEYIREAHDKYGWLPMSDNYHINRRFYQGLYPFNRE